MSSASPKPLLLDAARVAGLLERIAARIGARHVVTDTADLAPHLVEGRGLFRGTTPAMVEPSDTQEVAFIVAACAEAGVPVVPQGGNTGLVGGQMPFGGLLVSLRRLNRIRDLDPVDLTVVAEAGCTLHQVHEAATAAGCLFPLSIASEGSCQIGGNLSTNAGGTAVLRYGNMRELTFGLEVVLPDGRIWNGLSRLRKDNTGYALKDLFIGAEGTLGIITAAVLRLYPAPRSRATALIGLPDPHAALALFRRLRDVAGDALSGFEILPRFGMETVLKHMPGTVRALAGDHAWYVLAELSSTRRGDDLSELAVEVFAAAFEAGEIEDAVVAASEAQADGLWRLREALSDAQKFEGGSIKHDVSVPVSRVPDFIAEAARRCEAHLPGVRVCAFGHMGDGNIHFNLSQPVGMDKADYLARWEAFNRIVHDLVAGLGGSISAEHGIGLLKRDELPLYKDPVALQLMAAIKAAIDPAGIANPGKVLKRD
ncbi:FAD-binding oxidoreductase [Xanthobacter dioxanivorans]|uniref:FAD-binding oxidoreductase n=1 Tax=Xanthobacter dioxanivorans TaxID=2528964 RepID=A0A974PSI4_9HYPH|nr:FAD-binding oxidoreductase [Xanthobacter dioxanivorans]QRG08554.1 FAD-binding oxidoreductase [Xanthobacter dioxanivorans]